MRALAQRWSKPSLCTYSNALKHITGHLRPRLKILITNYLKRPKLHHELPTTTSLPPAAQVQKTLDSERIRQLGEREFQVLEQLDGDVVIGQYWCFSEDASTLMRWGVGKAPDGGSKAFFETFGRVAD